MNTKLDSFCSRNSQQMLDEGLIFTQARWVSHRICQGATRDAARDEFSAMVQSTDEDAGYNIIDYEGEKALHFSAPLRVQNTRGLEYSRVLISGKRHLESAAARAASIDRIKKLATMDITQDPVTAIVGSRILRPGQPGLDNGATPIQNPFALRPPSPTAGLSQEDVDSQEVANGGAAGSSGAVDAAKLLQKHAALKWCKDAVKVARQAANKLHKKLDHVRYPERTRVAINENMQFCWREFVSFSEV